MKREKREMRKGRREEMKNRKRLLWITLLTALVSSTKRLSVIPLVPEVPLVCNAVAVSARGKNVKIPRNGLTVWGIGHRSSCWGRSENKNGPSHRYFTGNFNGQPVVGGYFYGLCNAHKENIA